MQSTDERLAAARWVVVVAEQAMHKMRGADWRLAAELASAIAEFRRADKLVIGSEHPGGS